MALHDSRKVKQISFFFKNMFKCLGNLGAHLPIFPNAKNLHSLSLFPPALYIG